MQTSETVPSKLKTEPPARRGPGATAPKGSLTGNRDPKSRQPRLPAPAKFAAEYEVTGPGK